MNILLLGRYNETETLSGPEKFAKRLFQELSLTPNKITFLEYFFNGKEHGLINKLFGKEQILVSNNSQVLRVGIVKMIFYILKTKPELIHFVTFERFSILLWPLILIRRIRTLYTVHGVIAYENKFLKKNISKTLRVKDYFAEKMLTKYSNLVCFLTSPSKNLMNQYFQIETEKERYIKNGSDKIFRDIKRTSPHKKLKIVFAGGLIRPEKGSKFLFDTIKDIKIDFELYILTNTSNLGKQEYLKDERIIVLDYMDTCDLASFYADKDIYLSLSFFDTFPISALEAMSAGLVPIMTEETGVSTLIKTDFNGIIIKFGDSEALKSAIKTLADDRTLLLEMSNNAREIYDQFNWRIVSEEYKGLYQMLLASREENN